MLAAFNVQLDKQGTCLTQFPYAQISNADFQFINDINPDDLIALHRGDPVNKVFKRRERLNEIVYDAEEDPKTISFNQTEYADLITKSRGLNPNDTRNISLRDDTGWDLGQFGNLD